MITSKIPCSIATPKMINSISGSAVKAFDWESKLPRFKTTSNHAPGSTVAYLFPCKMICKVMFQGK